MIEWVKERLIAAWRALVLGLLSFLGGLPLLILTILSIAFIPLFGAGLVLLPAVTNAVRQLANQRRELATRWSGVTIPEPYRPEPAATGNDLTTMWRRVQWILTDPATWRDVAWMAVSPVNFVLGLLPAAMISSGIQGLILAPLIAIQVPGVHAGLDWVVKAPAGVWVGIGQFVVLIPLGLLIAPIALQAHQRFAATLLSPTAAAVLSWRVDTLTESRAQVVGDQAAALRQIERDLHDGAQARLVALSMNLGMASDMFDSDPQRAQQLVAEAHAASQTALTELRGLVRGIQPPVLAERGLAAAIEAVAFTLPVPVRVVAAIPAEVPAPAETAVYFAVTECLANIVKHAHATSATVDLRAVAGAIRATVSDDGIGGADARRGTGLAGVTRRLEALDGTLTVLSPDGGPTVVTLEVPCASLSPRTTHSSGTA